MAIKKIAKFFGNDDEIYTEEGVENTYYELDHEEAEEEGIGNNKMILLEPRAYSEAKQIVGYLKKRSAVLVNLKRVTPDQAKRIVDYLLGATEAMGGDLQKVGGGIFLCTPNNIKIDGKITTDQTPKAKKGPKTQDEFDF